jgi:SsrA-binding protein
MATNKKEPKGDPLICSNKNAGRDYHLIEKVEAGLVLLGTEVKAIRQGSANIHDAYGIIENEEVYLINMHIAPYSHGNRFNHEPLRRRKLLLHKHQVRKLIGALTERGYTLVPTRLYWSKGRVKAELALGKGKTKGDRRDDVKRRSAEREIDVATKRARR